MIKLQYIWHDCFLFQNDKIAVVFDYWKDPLSQGGELPKFLSDLDKKKPFYVLVSHHHKDHYVKEIFNWSQHFPNIKYILSNDTAKFSRHIIQEDSLYIGIKPKSSSIIVLKPGEVFCDSDVKVSAFDSTDIGNSFAIETVGTTIFHAGDLNAWIWKDESPEEEVAMELDRFTDILDKIAEKYPEFDIAMFPVDSRIGTDYFTGAKLFVNRIYVRHFFPMHFCLGTEEEQTIYQLNASAIDKYANSERGEYICLQKTYSCFYKFS